MDYGAGLANQVLIGERLAVDKVCQWSLCISLAIIFGFLMPGDASELAMVFIRAYVSENWLDHNCPYQIWCGPGKVQAGVVAVLLVLKCLRKGIVGFAVAVLPAPL